MTAHRYAPAILRKDMIRGAMGLAATLLPLSLVPDAPVAAAVLGTLAVLFTAFLIRTALRRNAVVEVDEQSIKVGARQLAWSDLEDLRLRFFSTKRDRSEGWMELRVSGKGRKLSIDSTLEGFDAIAARAARAANANAVTLSEATLDNLRAMGLRRDGGRA